MCSYMNINGSQFVIRGENCRDGEQKTPPQWRAWMDWFASRNIPTRAKEFHGVATMPTEWPEQFDVTATPSDRSYRFPFGRQPDELTLAERVAVADQYRRAVISARFPRGPHAGAYEIPREDNDDALDSRTIQDPATKDAVARHHEAKVAEKASYYVATPVVAGEALLRALKTK